MQAVDTQDVHAGLEGNSIDVVRFRYSSTADDQLVIKGEQSLLAIVQFGEGVGKGAFVIVLVTYSVLTCVVDMICVAGPQYEIAPGEFPHEEVQVYFLVENVVLSYSVVVVKVL